MVARRGRGSRPEGACGLGDVGGGWRGRLGVNRVGFGGRVDGWVCGAEDGRGTTMLLFFGAW